MFLQPWILNYSSSSMIPWQQIRWRAPVWEVRQQRTWNETKRCPFISVSLFLQSRLPARSQNEERQEWVAMATQPEARPCFGVYLMDGHARACTHTDSQLLSLSSVSASITLLTVWLNEEVCSGKHLRLEGLFAWIFYGSFCYQWRCLDGQSLIQCCRIEGVYDMSELNAFVVCVRGYASLVNKRKLFFFFL